MAEDTAPGDNDVSAEPDAEARVDVEADADEAFPVESLMDVLRQAKVSELLLSTVSTLASVAYGKLDLPDLPEAKAAIDAIGVLLSLLAGQLDEGILRDFEQALASLRLAYADAVSRAE